MGNPSAEKIITESLAAADVQINGTRPWDIRILEKKMYNKLARSGSLALGETYMKGWWECESLDQFFERILKHRVDQSVKKNILSWWRHLTAALPLATGWFPAFAIGRRHYDIGNDLFCLMLDKWMNYSCAYWKNASDLDSAQEAKMDLICRKLYLEPGMDVLDIGCGWGGLAAYMATTYGVRVTGVTVSKEQWTLARKRCQGLPVKIHLQDYRKIQGQFQRIVSVGMFEHVGVGNYPKFMKIVNQMLAPRGLFLLHTIAGNQSRRCTDPWIRKYIFPNSMIPSARQIIGAAEGRLVLEDWHSFGPDYDPTLMAWHKNFSTNWDRIKAAYDPCFFRMWTYYLLACAGSFRARRNQLWQIVFSKEGHLPRYECLR